MTVCKLCDKAVAAGSRVFVHAPDGAACDAIDKLLWTFRQGSFISHERFDGAPLSEPLPAVLLGAGDPPPSHTAVLINLGSEVPANFSQFERVLEIVPGGAARERS